MVKEVKVIAKFIKRYWNSANKTQAIQFWNTELKYNFWKEWHRSGITIRFTRLIRGDLIEVWNAEGVLVLDYVDQSHQYPSLLGFNDIKVHPSCDLKIIENYLR